MALKIMRNTWTFSDLDIPVIISPSSW